MTHRRPLNEMERLGVRKVEILSLFFRKEFSTRLPIVSTTDTSPRTRGRFESVPDGDPLEAERTVCVNKLPVPYGVRALSPPESTQTTHRNPFSDLKRHTVRVKGWVLYSTNLT